eukprot:TRINITY_DN38908_c0_g1_i1.p1 TRINITY_DN38908_c0_g1~~TRINITY_DN38908_c0_g1_i1.p1  ORF type:complete len:574 (-),score=73.84 TRINITY_DN38908_c0_g1_i1:286-2007(-)
MDLQHACQLHATVSIADFLKTRDASEETRYEDIATLGGLSFYLTIVKDFIDLRVREKTEHVFDVTTCYVDATGNVTFDEQRERQRQIRPGDEFLCTWPLDVLQLKKRGLISSADDTLRVRMVIRIDPPTSESGETYESLGPAASLHDNALVALRSDFAHLLQGDVESSFSDVVIHTETTTSSDLDVLHSGRVPSVGEWASFGAPKLAKNKGRFYHEIIVVDHLDGPQFGWATLKFIECAYDIDGQDGVGDDDHSWACDGQRELFWHGGDSKEMSWPRIWMPGDVIGLAIDIDGGRMRFSLNGHWLHGEEQPFDSKAAFLFPAVTSIGPFKMQLTSEGWSHSPPDATYHAWSESGEFSRPTTTKEHQAHRAILAARSPVFRVMLQSTLLEGTQRQISVVDVDSHAMDMFLIYLYTGELKVENFEWEWPQRFWTITRLADKYQVACLLDVCKKLLVKHLCIANFCRTLIWASELRDAWLMHKCLNFASSDQERMKRLQDQREFDDLPPPLLRQLLMSAYGAGKSTKRKRGDFEFPDDSRWERMSIAQLHRACGERGLNNMGDRAVLIARLRPENE